MRRVNDAPALIDAGMLEQPFNRPSTAPCHTVAHFLLLLGGVYVHALERIETEKRRERFRRDGAQRMRRNSHAAAGPALVAADRRLHASDDPGKLIEIGDEASLAGSRWSASEPARLVEHRQKRKADARRIGRREMAQSELGGVCVQPARRCAVQVVKFSDAR